MRRILLYLASRRRLVLRQRSVIRGLRIDLADAVAAHSELAKRCCDLHDLADALLAGAVDCPTHKALHARLEHFQAVSEAMDLPVGLDISTEDWRTAVTALAAQLAAEQRKAKTAVPA
jgi:hypothetical protein